MVVTAVDEITVQDITVPAPAEGEVLVRIEYSCVSPGTDLRVIAGKQFGQEPFPLVPGYSAVGTVEQVGPGVSLAPGTRVFAMGPKRCSINTTWGAHSSHCTTTAEGCVPLPESLDPKRAVLGKLTAIAYHGALRSRVRMGDTVIVIGLGPIGILAALCHAHAGARVVAVDVSPDRVELARKIGIEAWPVTPDLHDRYYARHPHGPDVIVDSTGSEPILRQSLKMARLTPWGSRSPASRLLVQGSYASDLSVDYDTAFRREIEIITTRDHGREDLVDALALIADGSLPVDAILSKTVPYREAPEIYHTLKTNKGALVTAAFSWAE